MIYFTHHHSKIPAKKRQYINTFISGRRLTMMAAVYFFIANGIHAQKESITVKGKPIELIANIHFPVLSPASKMKGDIRAAYAAGIRSKKKIPLTIIRATSAAFLRCLSISCSTPGIGVVSIIYIEIASAKK
jgi:hypothetical protein